MKNTSFIFIFLSFLFFANAQVELNSAAQQEFKSQVIKSAQATKSILSDFTQEKHLSILENPVVSEGKLAFQSPNMVKWEYTEPYHSIALFKDDKLYVTNDGKKDELNLDSNKLFRSLNTLIVNSIKGDLFDDMQFDISYFKLKDMYLVIFVPKEKRLKKFISKFELVFSQETHEVQQVKLVEPNEDFTLISFQKRQINISIPTSTFNH